MNWNFCNFFRLTMATFLHNTRTAKLEPAPTQVPTALTCMPKIQMKQWNFSMNMKTNCLAERWTYSSHWQKLNKFISLQIFFHFPTLNMTQKFYFSILMPTSVQSWWCTGKANRQRKRYQQGSKTTFLNKTAIFFHAIVSHRCCKQQILQLQTQKIKFAFVVKAETSK